MAERRQLQCGSAWSSAWSERGLEAESKRNFGSSIDKAHCLLKTTTSRELVTLTVFHMCRLPPATAAQVEGQSEQNVNERPFGHTPSISSYLIKKR